MRLRRTALMAAAALGFAAGFTLWSADRARQGEELFQKMCTGCHALDSEKEGPRLRGVFGRRSGTVENFPYSKGLKSAGIVWDERALDRWLADPAQVAPDNDMAFRLEDAEKRAALIAYLKSLGSKP